MQRTWGLLRVLGTHQRGRIKREGEAIERAREMVQVIFCDIQT